MSVSAVAVRRPVATTMACVGIVLLGLVSYQGLPIDLLPDVSTPRITIMTRASGLAPLEVERLVTEPLESQVARVPALQRTSSVSREGMSVITLSFPWGIDVDLAALHVREAIDRAAGGEGLASSADRPAVLRWDPGSEPVMGVAVAGSATLGALRELVEAVVVTRLEQVEGIAGGQVTGGAEREIQVELDPDRLSLYELTVTDVMNSIEASNRSSRSGAVLQGTFRYSVQVLGEFLDVAEIASVPVGQDPQGLPLTVGDVGRVYEGTRPRLAGALLDGEPAVGVLLYKESGINTIQAVAAAQEALEELRAEYPELTLEVAFENASFIQEAIDSVVQNITIGGILAFAVLFLFLRDPRNPVLLGVSIPVSLIATFVMCYFAGITLNIMTLGGLALGVGMLVDNSIVVLENIYRHRQLGAPAETAACRGADEVALAVTAATLTTIAVFLPIAYVHGVAGELFSPQAWTVTFALLASLVVSLTVLPMLAGRFLRFEGLPTGQEGEAPGAGAPEVGRPPARVVPADPDATLPQDDGGSRRGESGGTTAAGPDDAGPGADRDDTGAAGRQGAGDPGERADDDGERSGDDAGTGAAPGRVRRSARRVSDAVERLLGVVGRGLATVGTALLALPLFWVRGLLWLVGIVLGPLVVAFAVVYDAAERFYDRALAFCLEHKGLTVLGALLLAVLAGRTAAAMPFELMPPVNAGRFDVTVDAPPGTPFEELERIVRTLESTARQVEGVGTTFATLGLETGATPGAASGVMALSPTRAFLTVVMAEGGSRTGTARADAAMEAVRREAARLTNVSIVIDPQRSPLERLLGAEATGFRIALRGDDLDTLDLLAEEAVSRMAGIEGLDDVVAHNTRGNPEIRLRVDREAARRYGVTVDEVTDAMVGALQGRIADTQFVEFDRRIDIRISAREGIEDVDDVLDRLYPTGIGQIPLRQLVTQEVSAGPTEIVRTDRVREIPVTASLSGVRLSDAMAAAQEALADMAFPVGYRYRVAGEREEVDASFRSLGWALALAALLVYMVMAAQFESLRHPFVILLTLPLGWTGVVLALWLTGMSINVVALIGAVVLTGIIVNDAIVKVDTINRLRRDEGYPLRRAVVEGSHLRLRPILMTTVTTACALVPMALGLGAGAELQQPLAVAIIGGEATGTLLTLVVIPVFYELFDRRQRVAESVSSEEVVGQET